MNPLVWVYLGYLVYAIYTGCYVYNRSIGRSAQFGPARISPEDSRLYKVFADCAVAVAFLFSLFVVVWISV